ncbi:protein DETOXIFICATION [Citrus sinensis]|uniref:Protein DETOXIFICATION n=1 Tax=Citrus sinensis TaxID=2711 RepID=A0ACB8K374_CITSI|nr:protein DETOXIFICATION [Citrus sinensis]
MDMEVGESQEKRWAITWGGFMEELKKTGRIAAPMVAVSVLQYLLQVVSTVMVGHLSQLALSSVAIATSLTNVTGFSLLSGMAGGLETLCGQAYGAAQFRKLGVHTYTAIISLILVCPLVCLLWIFMDKLLPLIGQDPVISHEARKYSMWLIPALFGSAILKPLTRYFQTQSLILPMFASSFLILCFHIPACWTLVFKLELGSMGAALAFSLSTWLNVILLGLYMMYSLACEKTRAPVSKESLLAIGQFFRLAIPSAIMVCLTISTLHFTIPYAFGVAARLAFDYVHVNIYVMYSTRVSNELGAGNLQAARVAVWAATSYAVVEAVIVGTILFCCRYFLGYAYTKDNQVVHYVAVMAPLICLSVITDSLQAVFSGVAKGCGWQHIGVYINLGAFYLVGLPVGAALGFVAHLRGKGLWIGIVAGSVVQSTLLSLATTFTNWKKQAAMARMRVVDGCSAVQND